MKKNRPLLLLFISTLTLLINSCQMADLPYAQDTSTYQKIDQQLKSSAVKKPEQNKQPKLPPSEISDALLPPLAFAEYLDEAGKAIHEEFDISVEEIAIRDFFFSLVKSTPYNIVVDPSLSGTLTLDLKDVTIDQVMDIIRDTYGYEYQKKGRIYRVFPPSIRTEIFKINYVDLNRIGGSTTIVSGGSVRDSENNDNQGNSNGGESNNTVLGASVTTTTESDFWNELIGSLSVIIGATNDNGYSVVVARQAGVIAVTAPSNRLHIVKTFLEKTQLIIQRQVLIEAKVLEVRLNDSFSAGINWSLLTEIGGPDKTITFNQSNDPLINPDGIGGIFQTIIDLNDFSAVIELLETQGAVQVLSSPRISTVNNQKAVIKVGTDEFFVTDVSISTDENQNTGDDDQQVNLELTPFFSGIALDVTPQIADDGQITLHIHPTVSEVQDQQKVIDVGLNTPLVLPLALSTVRESDSIISSKNGQVVVIGGLMKDASQDVNANTPWLAKLPIIGDFFRQVRQVSEKSELVILLRPTVVDQNGLNQFMDQTGQHFDELYQRLGTEPR